MSHRVIFKTLRIGCESQTEQLATRLAQITEISKAFITLAGQLGSGKTTFTRYLLKALGVSGRVKSPTYTIVEPYRTDQGEIWHFDFYRFQHPEEWEDAGFRDIFCKEGLKLAEWPEKVAEQLPIPDLELEIEQGCEENERTMRFKACTLLGETILAHFDQIASQESTK